MLSLRSLRILSRRTTSHLHTTALLLAKKKTIQQFRLADIGEGITECEVIKWCATQAFHSHLSSQ